MADGVANNPQQVGCTSDHGDRGVRMGRGGHEKAEMEPSPLHHSNECRYQSFYGLKNLYGLKNYPPLRGYTCPENEYSDTTRRYRQWLNCAQNRVRYGSSTRLPVV